MRDPGSLVRYTFGILLLVVFIPLKAQEDILMRYYEGDFARVISETLERIDSGDTALNNYYLKALSEAQTGKPAEAIQTLHKALDRHPGEQRTLRMLASQYYELGNYPQASEIYRDLVRSDSGDIASWLKLAEIASFKQQYPEAVRSAGTVLGLDPENLSALILMGELMNRQNSSSAVIYYERAWKHYPGNQKVAYALGNWYIQAEQPQKAIPVCELVLENDSASIRFHKLLGFASYRAGKTVQAVRSLIQAVDLGDSTVFTFKYLGISHYLNFDFQRAVEALSVATEKDTTDAEVHFFLGSSLGNTTRKQEAMYHLDRSLELMQPDGAVVARIYSEQGNIMRLEMEYEKAYALYEKSWQADTTNPVPIYYMASILDNSLRRSREALADYRRFIEQLDAMPPAEEKESGSQSQIPTLRNIVEDRIELLTEELFFLDERPVKE